MSRRGSHRTLEARRWRGLLDVRGVPGVGNHGEVPISAEPTKVYSFLIHNGDDVAEVAGRRAAVHKAKEVSSDTGRPVRLERADGKMTMQFHRGALQTFRLETR